MSHSLQSEINYLASLHGEGDDYEDGGAVGEVAGALEDRREDVGVDTVSGQVQVVGEHLGGYHGVILRDDENLRGALSLVGPFETLCSDWS